MTVVVYKAGIMAADTGAWRGNFLVSTSARKIIRLDNGHLVGCSGSADDIANFQQWARDGFIVGDEPKMGGDFGAIVVSREGHILEFDSDMKPTNCSLEGYASEGDAQEFCFALHKAGFSADDIVALAIESCVWAAGRVYSVNLNDEEGFSRPINLEGVAGEGPLFPDEPQENASGDFLVTGTGDPPEDHLKKFLTDRGLE